MLQIVNFVVTGIPDAKLTPATFPTTTGTVLPPLLSRGSLGGVGFRPYSGATPAQTVSWGAALPQGVLHPTDGVTLAGAPIQMDVVSTYPDGSVRLAGFAARVPALGAGQWCQGALEKAPAPIGGLATPTSPVSGTTSLAGHSLDLSTVAPQQITRQGPLMVEWTARVPMPSVSADFEISLDVRQYSDGTPPLIDVGFARTRVSVTAGAVSTMPPVAAALSYTATISSVGGQSATITIPQHGLARIWHWTANEPPVHVIGDTATLRAAGAMILDDACGVPNSVLAALNVAPDTPLGHGDITQYFPTTGDRSELATAPEDQAMWMLSQDPRAALHALTRDAADWSGVPWHYRDIATARWVSTMDYPTVWIAGTGYRSINTISSGDGWTPDAAHAACFSWVPWVMTLRLRYWRDLAAQATQTAMYLNPAARLNNQGILVSTPSKPYAVQTRGQAWGMRTFIVAAAFLPDSDPFKAYFGSVLANNLAGQRAWITQAKATQGDTAPWIPGAVDPTPWNTWAPWCGDYMVSSMVLGDRLGFGCGDIAMAFATPLLKMATQNGVWPANFPAVFQAPGYDEKGAFITTWDKAAQVLNAGALTVTVSLNTPLAGDALTIGGTTVTFVASGATGNQVNIGASNPATLTNLVALLSASADPGLSSATYSRTNASSPANNGLYVTPKGASIAVTSSIQARVNVAAAPVHQYPTTQMTGTALSGGTAMSAERYATARLMLPYNDPTLTPMANAAIAKYNAAVGQPEIAAAVTNAGSFGSPPEGRWRVK